MNTAWRQAFLRHLGDSCRDFEACGLAAEAGLARGRMEEYQRRWSAASAAVAQEALPPASGFDRVSDHWIEARSRAGRELLARRREHLSQPDALYFQLRLEEVDAGLKVSSRESRLLDLRRIYDGLCAAVQRRGRTVAPPVFRPRPAHPEGPYNAPKNLRVFLTQAEAVDPELARDLQALFEDWRRLAALFP